MVQVITRCRLTGHYMFMGMDVDPKEFPPSPGPFARKFCPFCACDHLWHKEDARFVAIKPVSRPRIQQASAISMGSGGAASGGRAAVNPSSATNPHPHTSQLLPSPSFVFPRRVHFPLMGGPPWGPPQRWPRPPNRPSRDALRHHALENLP